MESEEQPADEICQMCSVELRPLYTFLFESRITPFGKKHTVDGKNPAPVDMVNIPLFTGFWKTSPVVGRISEPSTVQLQNIQ